MPKQRVIKVQQFDKEIPIEFYVIQDNVELFDFTYHYQYNFYQIYWFTQAKEVTQQIDFKNYAIHENQIWIIYPGQVQFFDPTSTQGYYLAIDKDYFNRILNKETKEHKLRFSPPLQFEVALEKKPLFEAMLYLIRSEWQSKKRTELLEKYLDIFLTHVHDLKELSSYNELSDHRVYHLLQLVEQNFTDHHPNAFYADKIALSVKRMNEMLVQATQQTLNQHIHQRIILEAKRLIGYSNLTILEIADQLGFSEVNYFNRFFKKHLHTTPVSFRKKVKKVQ